MKFSGRGIFCHEIFQSWNIFSWNNLAVGVNDDVNDPVLRGSAIPDAEALVVLSRMVEVYSEVINAYLHVIRAL